MSNVPSASHKCVPVAFVHAEQKMVISVIFKDFLYFLYNLYIINHFKGYNTPKPKLACFVLYLKIINRPTFLKNNVWIL